MAVTSQGFGTQTAVINTEQTLLDVAVAGTFTLHVDLNAMAAADVVTLRIYQMVLTATTRRIAYRQSFSGVQADVDGGGQIAISVAISNELTDAGALRFTLQQTAGTGRSFPWKVLKYA